MPTALEKARSQPDGHSAAILAAARRVFAQRGYHGASTRAIAAEVGLDVSTLYYHWGSKRELFDGVLMDLQERFSQLFVAWLEEASELEFDAAFDRAVELAGPFMGDDDSVRVLLYSVFDAEFEGAEWAVESQRLLVLTIRRFAEKRLAADLPLAFDALVLSTIGAILALVGGRRQQAAVLGLDPDSEEYRNLVIETLRRAVRGLVFGLDLKDLNPRDQKTKDTSGASHE